MNYSTIFLLTFISAILIFVPIPYFPILMTAVMTTNLDPNLISMTGAFGALLAKLIVYLVSYYGRSLFTVKTRFNPDDYPETFRIINKYGGLAILVASITPIPDNIIYIPIGMCRYNPLKFALITLIGKITLNEIVVWTTILIGRPIVGNLIEINIDDITFIVAIGTSLAIFVLLFYLFFKINWLSIVERFFVKIRCLRR